MMRIVGHARPVHASPLLASSPPGGWRKRRGRKLRQTTWQRVRDARGYRVVGFRRWSDLAERVVEGMTSLRDD